ncbi:hypothetical protein D3C73_427420 [compost metagenome]
MWVNGVWLSQYLSAFDHVAVNTTQQGSDVVTSLSGIQQFTEHFNARNNGFFLVFVDTHDFNFFSDFNCSAFYATSCHSTAASDGEYVFDRHQERLVSIAFWKRNVRVDRFEHFNDLLCIVAIRVLQSFTSGSADDWSIVTWEFIFVQQIAYFHFNQFQKLFVFNHVAFVQEYDDVRNAYLAGQQDVFASLWHRAVSCGYNQDCSVHLRCASDHVFNIVGVSRAVYVCVVTVRSFIFNVSCGDSDTTFAFFWSFVDLVECYSSATVFFGQYSSDCSSQGCFTMVDVTDSTDVNVRFVTFKLCLCHLNSSSLMWGSLYLSRPPTCNS